jgi:hypothetical protein
MRADSKDGHGLDPVCFHNHELYEVIKECTGFDYLSDPEQRLAVVAFTEGITAAKASPWYK